MNACLYPRMEIVVRRRDFFEYSGPSGLHRLLPSIPGEQEEDHVHRVLVHHTEIQPEELSGACDLAVGAGAMLRQRDGGDIDQDVQEQGFPAAEDFHQLGRRDEQAQKLDLPVDSVRSRQQFRDLDEAADRVRVGGENGRSAFDHTGTEYRPGAFFCAGVRRDVSEEVDELSGRKIISSLKC